MMPMKSKKDVRAITSTALIVLIAILMVSASSVVVLLYTGGQPQNSLPVVKKGDNIKVNYIGRLADGRVFDTSLLDVASNDAVWPKSLSFTLRANTSYTPLQFVVGAGSMISGFDSGVLGMAKGQTSVITVPPEKGYGSMNKSLLFTADLLQQHPIYETLNVSTFATIYSYNAEVGLTVHDPFYGWDVLVVEVNSNLDSVLVMNKPVMNAKYAVYGDPEAASPTGWYAKVVAIDSGADSGNGTVTLRNQLTSADAGRIEGYDLDKASTFYVDDVDETAGTFRMNHNSELKGRTLYFTVTIVSIN